MKVLVIKAHPKDESFCHALADAYVKGAKKAGHEVNVLNLNTLDLEPFLKYEHVDKLRLPAELVNVQQSIAGADSLVFAYPTWWATPPALLKLFIEVILLSGFAFKYHESKGLAIGWDKLLKGKMARLIATMDGPPVYYRFYLGDPGFKMMNDILRFCGIKPVRRSYFGSVKLSSQSTKDKWLKRAYQIGLNEK
jgi:putative NADPH-quinone reductase